MDCTVSSFLVAGCKQGLHPYVPYTLAIVIPASVVLLCASWLLSLLFPQAEWFPLLQFAYLDLILHDSP